MKTTTLNNRSASLASAKALIESQQRKQAGGSPIPDDFWNKVDTRSLTEAEALAYLGTASEKYPVDASCAVLDDVSVDIVIDPYNGLDKKRRQLAAPGSDGCERLRYKAGQKTSVLDRILEKGDTGKIKIAHSTVHNGEIASVYAGVTVNGQTFRVGTMITTALAICDAMPSAKPCLIVVPVDGFEEA